MYDDDALVTYGGLSAEYGITISRTHIARLEKAEKFPRRFKPFKIRGSTIGAEKSVLGSIQCGLDRHSFRKGARAGIQTPLFSYEAWMYLEEDKCAQCGKALHDSARHAPHNADLSSHATNPQRPYFCSPYCVEHALESYFDKETYRTSGLDLDEKIARITYDTFSAKDNCDNSCKDLDRIHEAKQRELAKCDFDTSDLLHTHWQRTFEKKKTLRQEYDQKADEHRLALAKKLGELNQQRKELRLAGLNDAAARYFADFHTSCVNYEAPTQPFRATLSLLHRTALLKTTLALARAQQALR